MNTIQIVVCDPGEKYRGRAFWHFASAHIRFSLGWPIELRHGRRHQTRQTWHQDTAQTTTQSTPKVSAGACSGHPLLTRDSFPRLFHARPTDTKPMQVQTCVVLSCGLRSCLRRLTGRAKAFLQDESSFKQGLIVTGAAGIKCCLECRNVVNTDFEQVRRRNRICLLRPIRLTDAECSFRLLCLMGGRLCGLG